MTVNFFKFIFSGLPLDSASSILGDTLNNKKSSPKKVSFFVVGGPNEI